MEYVNPVMEAVKGYKAVDDIFRQDREEQRTIDQQNHANKLADETHGVQMATAQAEEAKRAREEDDRVLGGANAKVKQWQMDRMRDPSAPAPAFDDTEMKTITKYLVANPTLSNDPTVLARQAQAGRRLSQGLDEVAPYLINDQKKALTASEAPALFQDANTFLHQELQKGEDRYGNTDSRKDLVAVYSDENNNLLWGVRVTPKDPSQPAYEAPLTELRGADGLSKPIATPAAAFAGYVKANSDFANTAETAIQSALVRNGDKNAIKDLATQLNTEAARVAAEKVAQIEQEKGPLTYEQKRQLFVGLMPKGHTYTPADIKKEAEALYARPMKDPTNNIIPIVENNPKNPRQSRQRLIDKDNPAGGYVDPEPKGWGQTHPEPKAAVSTNMDVDSGPAPKISVSWKTPGGAANGAVITEDQLDNLEGQLSGNQGVREVFIAKKNAKGRVVTTRKVLGFAQKPVKQSAFSAMVNGQGGGAVNAGGKAMTATNPQTGEKVASYDGGQTWQSIK